MKTLITLMALLFSGTALADWDKNVVAAFNGQVVVSRSELTPAGNDKATISKIKSARLTEVSGQAQGGGTAWRFHYTAFLSATGARRMVMRFTDGAHKAAERSIEGADPKAKVVSGEISISTDDGLVRGKSYKVELMDGASVRASTTLLMK